MNLGEVAVETVPAPRAACSCPRRAGPGRATARWSRYADDPDWRDHVLFFEYFDGDTGRGLGASHQTGWTALVACMLEECVCLGGVGLVRTGGAGR